MKVSRALFMALALISSRLLACDDTVPGALPPAPHGGIVEPMREAHSSSKPEGEEKKEKPEKEIFVEGTYQNKQVVLYPYTIKPPKTAVFSPIIANKSLSDVRLRVEFPVERKEASLPVTVTNDALVATLDAEHTHRFIVHLSATHGGESKRVKIQIENE